MDGSLDKLFLNFKYHYMNAKWLKTETDGDDDDDDDHDDDDDDDDNDDDDDDGIN